MAKRLQARRLDGIDHNPWVEFGKMASEYDVVNLGQGFPDFPPPDFAIQAFQLALNSDFMLNQYTKAFGYPPLTKILASFFGKLLGQEIDPLKNVLVTVGAYGALFTAFQALVDEGDEVIIVEPFFDCYEPMTLMAGGCPVFVTLKPSPTQDGKFTSRTKALILNTPNNPVGKVFSKAELELVASLCQQHDVICISDEVYQWLVYDGHQHISIGEPCLPGTGLAAIPVSVFYSTPHRKQFDHYVRFCFVKDESTLQAMDEKLQKWKDELRP
uniref:Kynurenine--oxoglutarate transaminase 1 n=1 Tax=Neovison vison TaxID=452646 RepID=A0A8C7ESW4_NEOVI